CRLAQDRAARRRECCSTGRTTVAKPAPDRVQDKRFPARSTPDRLRYGTKTLDSKAIARSPFEYPLRTRAVRCRVHKRRATYRCPPVSPGRDRRGVRAARESLSHIQAGRSPLRLRQSKHPDDKRISV